MFKLKILLKIKNIKVFNKTIKPNEFIYDIKV